MKKKKKGTWGGARERKVKKEPTKVIRVPVNKPDFEKIASEDNSINTHDMFLGFTNGCEYVWNKFIFKQL